MKNIIFLVALGVFPLIGLSQTEVNTELLDENNVGITLSDGGLFCARPINETFDDPTLMTRPGLEYPKGSGNYLMQGLSMWFGGVNEFEEPRVSTPTYKAYEDQFSGPLTMNSGYPGYSSGWSTNIFSVSREEINYHLTNYQNPNYVAPESISMWPAHGDASLDLDFYLAPFVDLNGDGTYNPYEGEYPCIQGDQAVYMILNDRRGNQGCGSSLNQEAMGIEIHYLFYQYSSIRELAKTTFCKTRVINRSSINYSDFSASVYMNALIGSGNDDFVGTDVERDMIFSYNGGEVDLSYGSQVPAVGVVSLNNSLSRTRVFGNYQNYGYHFPSFPPEFLEVMHGNLLTGESHPKRFGYPGDPVLGEGDIQSVSEQAHSMIYTIDIGDFKSGEEREFDFAIVVGQGVNHLESVQRLKESVDFVHAFYDEDKGMCNQGVQGIPATINPPVEPVVDATTIYPNPSNGEFVVEVEELWMGAQMSVFNTNGQALVNQKKVTEIQNNVSVANGPGVYLVTLEKDGFTKIFKAVIE